MVLERKGWPDKAAVILDECACDFLKIASLFDDRSRDYIVDLAAKNWIYAGRRLQKAGLMLKANDLYTKSIVALDKTVGNDHSFERVFFQLACRKAITGAKNNEQILLSLDELLKANKDKPWFLNESLTVSTTLNSLERYGFLLRLISLSGHKSEDQLASLYKNTAFCALSLGINNEASRYLEKYLQASPDSTHSELIGLLMAHLRKGDVESFEDAVKNAQIIESQKPNTMGEVNNCPNTPTPNDIIVRPEHTTNAIVIQNKIDRKERSSILSMRNLVLCSVGAIFALVVTGMAFWCKHKNR